MLLQMVPGGPGKMVDVYCRTGMSAATILPHRAQISYLGVDSKDRRLDQARQDSAHFGDRVRFERGEATKLPLPDNSVDYALCIRALENAPDVMEVLNECHRVLRPGGRLIAVEPDGVSETFYFNEHLIAYNAAFRWLCKRVDDSIAQHAPTPQQAPGMALGPQLAVRMVNAGFEPAEFMVFTSQNMKVRPFSVFAKRLRDYPVMLAKRGALPANAAEMKGVQNSVMGLEATIDGRTVGLSGHVLPLFIVMSTKR
jgi:ubiquinone/menaquinone biosynthesis C-methylase UbiE